MDHFWDDLKHSATPSLQRNHQINQGVLNDDERFRDPAKVLPSPCSKQIFQLPSHSVQVKHGVVVASLVVSSVNKSLVSFSQMQ